MATRLSGRNVTAVVGNYRAVFERASLSIEDGTKAAMTRGRPNGEVEGNKSANGEFELDWLNFTILLQAAREAGSWEQLPLLEIGFYADTGTETLKIEAFGCRIKISSLLNAEANGDTKSMVTLPYEVTGPEFVNLNGVPYLRQDQIELLQSSRI